MSFQQARNIEDVQDEYEPTRLEAAKWRIEELERELAECREALAAAEATMQTVADKLVRWDDYDEPDILDIIGLLESQDTAALDAALEQARQEGKYAGYRSCSELLRGNKKWVG